MPWLLALCGIALAATAWRVEGSEHGCRFFSGPTESSGAAPVRAECDWAVSIETTRSVLAQPGSHDQIFSSLAESRLLPSPPETPRIRQLHRAFGASDREVVVDFSFTEEGTATRYAWDKAADQSERLGVGIEPPMTRGFWLVEGDESRTRLTYEVRYIAGGRVPQALVRWFQGAGTRTVLRDLQTHLVTANEAATR